MSGKIRFGPEPFEDLAYIDWDEMLAEDSMVMKDEEMRLRVYGTAWAEGRAVCGLNFSSGAVDFISVGFD